MFGRPGFWWRSITGFVLALLVLVQGWDPEGGLGGPCDLTVRESFGPQAAEIRSVYEAWPPGERCQVFSTSGRLVGDRLYPEAWYWALALVALLSPFVALWIYRWFGRWQDLRPAASLVGVIFVLEGVSAGLDGQEYDIPFVFCAALVAVLCAALADPGAAPRLGRAPKRRGWIATATAMVLLFATLPISDEPVRWLVVAAVLVGWIAWMRWLAHEGVRPR